MLVRISSVERDHMRAHAEQLQRSIDADVAKPIRRSGLAIGVHTRIQTEGAERPRMPGCVLHVCNAPIRRDAGDAAGAVLDVHRFEKAARQRAIAAEFGIPVIVVRRIAAKPYHLMFESAFDQWRSRDAGYEF